MSRNTNTWRIWPGVWALTATAGMASAQQVFVEKKTDCDAECAAVIELERTDDTGRNVFVREIGLGGENHFQVRTQPERQTESTITIVQKNDDNEYKISITNGDDVKAWVNGDRVPSRRVKVTDDEIRILNEDGETIAEFGRAADMFFHGDVDVRRLLADARTLRGQGQGRGGIVWEEQDGTVRDLLRDREVAVVQSQPSPPVMVGINMGSVDDDDDDLVEFLEGEGLDAADAILINSVIDGLPADEAGLREGDVIIALDGDWGASTERLRDILMDREPGDELEVTVYRDGRVREYVLELQAYNAEKLGIIRYFEAEDLADAPMTFRWRADDGEEFAERMRKMVEELQEGERDTQEMAREFEEMARMLQLEARVRGDLELDALPRLRGRFPGEGRDQRLFVQPAPRNDFVVRGQEERLERLEDRLNRLEDRLDRVLEALERRERERAGD